MKKYLLTIIIPHYQSFSSLRTCLDSIPKDGSIQIIVVDDNSPDKDKYWENLIIEYSNVTFISLPENKGAGAARNLGLSLAVGKWLMFADADDYFVFKAFEVISNSYSSTADIVYFKADSIDLVTGISSYRHQRINQYIDEYVPSKKDTEGNLRFRCYGPVCKMIRKEIVDSHNIQFDEVRYSNDVMFSAKVGYYAKTIEVVNCVVYCITASSSSLTHKMNADSIMCRFQVSVRFYDFLKSIGEEKYQVVILRYFVLAIKYAPSCFIPMLKIAMKHKINIFYGLSKCMQIVKEKKSLVHF